MFKASPRILGTITTHIALAQCVGSSSQGAWGGFVPIHKPRRNGISPHFSTSARRIFAAIELLDAQEHEPLTEALPLLVAQQPERVFELTIDLLVDGIWSRASQPKVAAKKKTSAAGKKS